MNNATRKGSEMEITIFITECENGWEVEDPEHGFDFGCYDTRAEVVTAAKLAIAEGHATYFCVNE